MEDLAAAKIMICRPECEAQGNWLFERFPFLKIDESPRRIYLKVNTRCGPGE